MSATPGSLVAAVQDVVADPAAVDTAAAAGDTLSTLDAAQELLQTEGIAPLLRVGLIVLVGFPLLLALTRSVRQWVARVDTEQRGMIVSKLLFYSGAALLLVWVLDELGFGIAPLLGAAGILGIALGFASQTSVSNIISGVFLMAEQPFVVGEIIVVGNTVGIVRSVDMLSVKLRTFDNKLVRIPNESIIKTEVTNVTRFPIRRVDVAVGVAYKEDVQHVRETLLDVAAENPLCLMQPQPMVMFEGYGDSSLDFTFRVWAVRENWLQLKNTIHEDVKARFDREDIEIPFPHRTLYTGAVTDPFPVRLVEEQGGPSSGDDIPAPGTGSPRADPTDG